MKPVPSLTLEVDGEPGPQGSKTLYGGRMVESSKRVKPWRAAIKSVATKAGYCMPDGPVAAIIWLFMPRPKTVRTRPYPHMRGAHTGDIDKLVRSTLDALADAGVLVDDSRVVDLHVRKRYADLRGPGAVIHLSVMPREENDE